MSQPIVARPKTAAIALKHEKDEHRIRAIKYVKYYQKICTKILDNHEKKRDKKQ